MEENKFEKQVQKMMEGIKINPSDNVWTQVEARIRPKKKDRRAIVLFPLLLLILLGGGYYFIRDNSIEKQNAARQGHKENNGAIAPQPGQGIDKNSEEKQLPQSLNNKNFPISQINKSKKALKATITGDPTGKGLQSSRLVRREKLRPEEIAIRQDSHQDQLVAEIVDQSLAPVSNEPNSLSRSPDEANFQNHSSIAKEAIDKKHISIQKNEDDSVIERLSATPPITDLPVTAEHLPIEKARSHKWQWGIVFSAGTAHAGKEFLGLKSLQADYLQYSSAPGGNNNYYRYTSTIVRDGHNISLGIKAERRVSKKIHISFGLQYSKFNVTSLVGIKNDTTGSYSVNNAANKYSNNFSFAEVPVKLKWQLSKSSYFPIYWSNGITIAKLLKSNALQYDPSLPQNNQNANAYFKDNSYLNKARIGVNSSVDVRLASTEKYSVLLGPYFHYGVSKFANIGLYDKSHFVSFGLQAEILFGKK